MNDTEKRDDVFEFLVLGHQIKYNIYLLAKSLVFSALVQNPNTDVKYISKIVNEVMIDLDIENKPKEDNSSDV